MDNLHDGVISTANSTSRGFGKAMERMRSYAKKAMSDTIGQINHGISGIDKVEKFEVGDYIYSGDVSTLFSILHFVGEHVFWLSVVAFIIIVILSFIASVYLQKRAQRRLQEGSYNNVDRL